MNCAVHTDTPATGYCRNCGKALCGQCSREIKGALYCEDCLARRISAPAGGGVESHAALAGALGFIPGLGAVYNGEYMKALVHILIFGGIIAALTQDLPTALYPILGVGLGVFYFYMPIEAYRTAKAKAVEAAAVQRAQAGLPVEPGIAGTAGASVPPGNEGWVSAQDRHFNPIGAIILIGLGVLFLLGNFGLLREDWISRGWPLILIVVGVGLLFRKLTCRS
jgi:Domain of unknown function (DUF5668)/B-box zinc finger